MDLLQMKYFIAVAEEGTISAAARRLNISQPPLSVQIRNLEKECGIRLFERGARHIRLTEGGELLYKYAVRMLELRDSAENDLKNLKSGAKASIKIGIISSGECTELLSGLSAYRKKNPNISFRLYDANTYELLNELVKGRIELAVIRTPYKADNIDKLALRKDSFVLAGSEKYLDKYPKSPLPVNAIEDLPLITYRRWQDIIERELANAGINPFFVCINDDARTSIQWAEAGIGVALVPESILTLCPALPFRHLKDSTLTSTIHLVKQTDRNISEEASLLFDFMKERLLL